MESFQHKAHTSYSFGRFSFVPERQLLTVAEVPVRIGGRALDILTVLVEHAGDVVSKADLYARVWPSVTVDESNLKVNIALLRRALGESAATEQFIETVPGQGYRFVAPLHTATAGAALPTRIRHSLPHTTTHIIGRADIIRRISRDLDTWKMVSIVGPGGIGKTTVAIAVANHAKEGFPDGVWMVDFAPLKEPSLALDTIALALGIETFGADTVNVLRRHLAERKLLLVLDNCEHLAQSAADCADMILANAPQVRLIVTSREPLALVGEHVRILPGLEYPSNAAAITAARAMEFPAIQLFVARARDRLETFDLNDVSAPIVAEICRRLRGVALAIELAAMRVDAFGVREILNQLDNQFRLLKGLRGGLERQRTLMATIAWSYDLLPAGEAAFLRTLSVFAGSFSIDGASAIANRPASDSWHALEELAAKSLIAVDPDSSDFRYRLLETTRLYSLERLCEHGDEAIVRHRHADFICATLENAAREVPHRAADDWAAEYRPYLDDLRAALDWCEQTQTASGLLIRLTAAGNHLWSQFSSPSESSGRLLKAIERLDDAGMTGTATEMHLQTSYAYAIMFTRGLVPVIPKALQRAFGIAVGIADTEYQLRALRMIAGYQVFVGEHKAAIESLNAFIAVANANDPSALPAGQTMLALAEVGVGRLETAARRVDALWRNSLDGGKSPHYGRFEFDATSVGIVLSWSQWLMGLPETASATARTNLDKTVAYGQEVSLSNALVAASCPIAFWNGDTVQLGRYIDDLELYIARHGIGTWRPVAHIFRGAHAMLSNSLTLETIDSMSRAVEEFQMLNHWIRKPFYLGIFASALYEIGQFARAKTIIRTAFERADIQDENWCVPELLRVEAAIFTADGQHAAAQANLVRAMDFANSIGARSWTLRAANDLAASLLDQSRFDETRRMLEPIYKQFSEGFEYRDLHRAQHLLSAARLRNRA
ncbi:putative ATPase/DNA-binding winged helix-turn-helix (wHTH) protein [Rhizobium sp. SG_E_25_P2]|uniref:ATP-binding protein n=1 Tax=Rhizobium sp. SG_E_25_P2 TaxID=2879942 RepID=UPI002475CD38|nr:winged helix-turn-helix domain-containing protein [Rhizobium sp. SG_E_25_P2]MDH6265406.1 putative ATPase/DNA-binding winged helix-turn-helix (wHTH) protein [Rhizobium sp. SG_E_25_P2]